MGTKAFCFCGHSASAHVRGSDGAESCMTCAVGRGISPRGPVCEGFRDRSSLSGWPACACGHEFHKAHCRDPACRCSTYTVPASTPLLVQAASLRGAGITTVTVIVPLGSELSEEDVALAVGSDLNLASEAVYVKRGEGLYLVLKDDAHPDMVGETVLSAEEQVRRLQALRALLEERPAAS